MDKAVIFGVFDFVSFHMCKTLLNKGLEVNGVHIEKMDKVLFQNEKRLEVGRNANFLEQALVEWEKKKEHESMRTMLVISLYDLYMLKKERILLNEAVTKPIL